MKYYDQKFPFVKYLFYSAAVILEIPKKVKTQNFNVFE